MLVLLVVVVVVVGVRVRVGADDVDQPLGGKREATETRATQTRDTLTMTPTRYQSRKTTKVTMRSKITDASTVFLRNSKLRQTDSFSQPAARSFAPRRVALQDALGVKLVCSENRIAAAHKSANEAVQARSRRRPSNSPPCLRA